MSAGEKARLLLVEDLSHAGKILAKADKLHAEDPGALEAAKKAVARFTPMQAVMIPKDGGAIVYCANCKRDLSRLILEGGSYCPYCGQAHTGLPKPGGSPKVVLAPTGEGGSRIE